MTLETQYKNFLKNNSDSTFSFNEWMKWHSHQIEQAIIQIMQDDEDLGLYDEEIKLEDVFNDDKKENIKKFIHEVKSIPIEEILANRSSAYDFIDFDKQETLYNEEEVLVLLHKRDAYNFKTKSQSFLDWETPKEWFETVKKKS